VGPARVDAGVVLRVDAESLRTNARNRYGVGARPVAHDERPERRVVRGIAEALAAAPAEADDPHPVGPGRLETLHVRHGRVEGGGGRWRLGKANSTPASTATPPPTCTAFHRLAPPSTALVSIAHPPDPVASIVAHQQRTIRLHQQPDRSPPAGSVGQLPPGDEVLGRDGPAVLNAHAYDLGTRRHRTVPGPVIGHERIT